MSKIKSQVLEAQVPSCLKKRRRFLGLEVGLGNELIAQNNDVLSTQYSPRLPHGARAVEGGRGRARLLALVRRVHSALSRVVFVGHGGRQGHAIIIRYLYTRSLIQSQKIVFVSGIDN